MRFFAITLFLAALTIASPITEHIKTRGDTPDKKDIRIKSVSFSGTGCPPGTVWGEVGEDGTLLALRYSQFNSPNIGPSRSIIDARTFCNMRIGLDYPPGWTYTVAKTVMKGYLNIPNKCSAKLNAMFYFSGNNDDAVCSVKFSGPVNKYFKEDVTVSPQVWSKCGIKGKEGPLFNVNSDASVNCKEGHIGADFDTMFELKLLLQWKKC